MQNDKSSNNHIFKPNLLDIIKNIAIISNLLLLELKQINKK